MTWSSTQYYIRFTPSHFNTTHSFAMKTAVLFFPALFAALTTAQVATTLPNTLPACAQQCTELVGAQQSCASNPTAYQSCFCQSALLSSLYSSSPVQLCTQCSATDMASIQTWYKGSCSNGQPVAGANQPTSTTTNPTSPSTTSATSKTSAAAASTTVSNDQDSNSAQNAPSGPWYVHFLQHVLHSHVDVSPI